MNHNFKRVVILPSILLVILGIVIYWFRPHPVLFFSIVGIDTIGLSLPGWFLYSIPSGLWSWAYSLIICYLWLYEDKSYKYIWLFSILLMTLGWEFMQYFNYISGTFCYYDLSFSIVGILMGMLTIIFYKRRVINYEEDK